MSFIASPRDDLKTFSDFRYQLWLIYTYCKRFLENCQRNRCFYKELIDCSSPVHIRNELISEEHNLEAWGIIRIVLSERPTTTNTTAAVVAAVAALESPAPCRAATAKGFKANARKRI